MHTRASAGSANASVLPEPVVATATTSSPAVAAAHTIACTGVGALKPAACSAWTTCAGAVGCHGSHLLIGKGAEHVSQHTWTPTSSLDQAVTRAMARHEVVRGSKGIYRLGEWRVVQLLNRCRRGATMHHHCVASVVLPRGSRHAGRRGGRTGTALCRSTRHVSIATSSPSVWVCRS